jgi:hypothetical protein
MKRLAALCGVVVLAALGCGGKNGSTNSNPDAGTPCVGALGCSCFPNQTCNTGYVCSAGNECITATAGTGGGTGAGGVSGGSGGFTGGGIGGNTGCTVGDLACACFPNSTCNSGLACVANYCLPTGGTGGTTGAGGATGGGSGGVTGGGTGGVTGGGSGGVTGGGSGGVTGGGSGGVTGGGSGGVTGGGTGGCAVGTERCSCYGNNTCNASLICLSNLCVAPAGTGGVTGAGGTPTGTGGAGLGGATGTGGTPGVGGTTGTGGAPGVGGTTGGVLSFTSGVILGTSNSYGISGGVYTFSDMKGSTISPDCSTGAPCFGTTTGTGFCVMGTDTDVPTNTSSDYATYWGAAVGLDLNNPTFTSGAAMAYTATQKGFKGFTFTLMNLDSSQVRLTYEVRNTTTGNLDEYCANLSGLSTNTVLFTNAYQQCYNPVATRGPAMTAAQADHIEAIHWQVPSVYLFTTDFHFCIDSLQPVTQ